MITIYYGHLNAGPVNFYPRFIPSHGKPMSPKTTYAHSQPDEKNTKNNNWNSDIRIKDNYGAAIDSPKVCR